MIKIDSATDQLLEEIAAANEPTPELLRKVVPDRETFVAYLKDRGLLEDDVAQSLLGSLEENTQQPPKKVPPRRKRPSLLDRAVATATVSKVAAATGLKGKDIRRVLPAVLTPTGRLVPGWRRRLAVLVRKERHALSRAGSTVGKPNIRRNRVASKAGRRTK